MGDIDDPFKNPAKIPCKILEKILKILKIYQEKVPQLSSDNFITETSQFLNKESVTFRLKDLKLTILKRCPKNPLTVPQFHLLEKKSRRKSIRQR